MAQEEGIALVDAWREPEAGVFFRNVWPMYVHEISGFDTDFYALDATGRWSPDIVEDWISMATPLQNLRHVRVKQDPAQPFQRAHVITVSGRPVGFVCVGMRPFKFMPADADVNIAEFFLIHDFRGTGTAVRALALVVSRYPGRWHLRAIHDNARAIRFWRKELPSLGVRNLEEDHDGSDVIFRFAAGG